MTVTFPHLGSAYIPVGLTLKELGLKIVIPDENSYETLKEGSLISPEEICFPFKMMTGNILNARKKGADTVVMVSTEGPCRLGQYVELFSSVMKRNGTAMRWVLIESPAKTGIREFVKRIESLGEGKGISGRKMMKAFRRGRRLALKIDMLEEQIFFMAGYLKKPEEAISLRRKMFSSLAMAESLKEGEEIVAEYEKRTDRLKADRRKKPVKLLLAGEIYTCMDSFANGNIEEELIKRGVSFQKTMTLSWWIKNAMTIRFLKEKNIKEFPFMIGGYAHETVRAAMNYEAMGYDGVIMLMPSGCMPETVAKAVCEKTGEDKRLLHLVIDEARGEAGFITRLESFIDMIEQDGGKG